MRYFRSRYSSALQLLRHYNYPEPFHIAAKNFFKENKKFGSKDRKAISEVCYAYLRCGISMRNLDLEKGLLLSSLFLDFNGVEDWNKLSKEINCEWILPTDFFESGNVLKFVNEVLSSHISFYPEGCLAAGFEHYNDEQNVKFRPKSWAKEHTDKEVRHLGIVGVKELQNNEVLPDTLQIQDLSSQYVCSKIELKEGDKVWDVCSGSGGKSLNLSSQSIGDFYLSDVRTAILQNAKSRFSSMYYKAHFGVADMQKSTDLLKFGEIEVQEEYFDTVVLDVPCSGSGTWFRTPEHFARFDYDELENYSKRQKTIVKNASMFLKKGGKLYYITCSIFARENKEVRDWILANTDLKLINEMSFDGIRQKADGMYMAKFEKPQW